MIRFKCALCGANIEAADQPAGGIVRCPDCGHETAVPDAQAPGSSGGNAGAASPAESSPSQFFPPPQQYPYYNEADGRPHAEGTAIASFILGLMGMVCFFMPAYGVGLGAIAIFLGCLGRRAIARDPGRYKGVGIARAGIIFGAIGIIANATYMVVQWG
ncbi:MAG: hypothetical protein ACE15C_03750 [Phycisphaerae bacterium]